MDGVPKCEVRPAAPAELEAVAGLRGGHWVAERDGLPKAGREAFVRAFAAWARANAATVHSSERAVPAYERRGFAASPQLLQTAPPGGRDT
jgi:hypothetical protein